MDNFQVAIDGPAGSGKSSISSIVSKKLGFTHIDTGAMYRAVCLEALNRNIDLNDENNYDFVNNIRVTYIDGKTFLNGKDVSKEIRTPNISANVSTVAKFMTVRNKMVEFQRESAKYGYVLMDGRDIGSVVLKDADVKIYLTASVEERANRRYKELKENGEDVNYDDILSAVKERDYKDSTRENSPLIKASDAIEIDTSLMTIEEVTKKIIDIINERMNNMKDLYETNMVSVGDTITGTVISVGERQISLDIHTFTEGTMYIDYYTLDKSITSFKGLVNVGDTILCQVAKVDEENGHILLTRINEAKKEAFNKYALANVEKPITVSIRKKVNKGYMTSYNGVDFFLPESEVLTVKKQGDKVKVLVLRVEEDRNSGLVSEKAYVKQVENETKAKEFSNLHVGDVIKGLVTKVEQYGAFVKFGHLQGLIRLKELDHIYVANANNVLKVNDEVEAKIISLENGKIDLSLKAMKKSPIELFNDAHKVSDVIKAKVVQKLPFGVVCEVFENLNGLLHVSELSWNPNDNSWAYIHIGDELEVAIVGIDINKNKVSLSKKVLIDNPWSRVTAKEGDLIDAKVLEVTAKGLKIEALGVDGTVDVRDIKLDKSSSKLDDYYQEGDMVKAIITKVDPKSWILKASIKDYQEIEERKQYEEFMSKQEEEAPETTIGDLFKDLK